MAIKVTIEINIDKGHNTYEFANTDEGKRILQELRDSMDEQNLYFYTPYADSMVLRAEDKEAIIFVNQFLDDRAVTAQ